MCPAVRGEKSKKSNKTKETDQPKGEIEQSVFGWEQLRIRNKHGKLVELTPNRAQLEYALKQGKRNIVLKARQLGITTYIAAQFFLETINRPGTLTVQVAHDQRAAESIFRIVHRFLENLPEPARTERLKTSRANVRQIVFKKLDSEYRVETAADFNAGRGSTIQNLHCSEVAMWPGDAAGTLAGLRAAVPPEGQIVLESSPRGAAGAFYEEWQRSGETGYVQHFFPWWWEESYRRQHVKIVDFSEEELALIAQHGLDPEQIAFRREVKANFGQRAREEFAEDAQTCFRTSGECVFDLEFIEERLKTMPAAVESRDNGRLQLYFPPVAGKKYIIAVDPAGGSPDGDYACVQVIDREQGLQCAELLGHLRPEELVKEIARLAGDYKGSTVVVERNNHGHAVLAFLQNAKLDAKVFCEQDGQEGWLTNVANRPRIIEQFGAMLRTASGMINSRRLLEQCRTFVRGKDGRPEAASGAHDDAVMAMAIALAARERT